MAWFARMIYGALVWKERQRASKARKSPAQNDSEPQDRHIETGERGETLAYWYLRRSGYTIVARNLRLRSGSGELDLVGWDGPVLAFVEVKTRTSAAAGQPEDAVTREQRRRIRRAALDYLRRLGPKPVNYRFDIASIFWDPAQGYQVRLVKDAFKN
jgi:putative endonuclease